MAETGSVYPLDSEKVYYSMDELTLDTDEGPKTLRVGAWLNFDPVRIHRMIVREKTMQVDQFEVYNPLMSKLRRADQQYYKQFMGLGLTIDFPGYTSEILARIPFENDRSVSTNGGAKESTRTRSIFPRPISSNCSRKSP